MTAPPVANLRGVRSGAAGLEPRHRLERSPLAEQLGGDEVELLGRQLAELGLRHKRQAAVSEVVADACRLCIG